ncbi:hypothetical protein ACKWTF_016315 [Chironomus riparius]
MLILAFGVLLVGCTASSIGGERVKEFAFSPHYHNEGPTDEASSFVSDTPKLSICDAYKTQLSEPKPKKTFCNVKCETFTTVKCTLPELDIPECNEYAAYVYKRILSNFEVMKQNDFACELPTAKDYKIKPKLSAPISSSETKKSKFCEEYKKLSTPSDFEFPCYIKCDSYIVGVSLEGNKLDWELTCESYQHACTFESSDIPMKVGSICEAFRRYVMSKVKLGERDYHHCNVYNHGPQFDYYNRTLH